MIYYRIMTAVHLSSGLPTMHVQLNANSVPTPPPLECKDQLLLEAVLTRSKCIERDKEVRELTAVA